MSEQPASGRARATSSAPASGPRSPRFWERRLLKWSIGPGALFACGLLHHTAVYILGHLLRKIPHPGHRPVGRVSGFLRDFFCHHRLSRYHDLRHHPYPAQPPRIGRSSVLRIAGGAAHPVDDLQRHLDLVRGSAVNNGTLARGPSYRSYSARFFASGRPANEIIETQRCCTSGSFLRSILVAFFCMRDSDIQTRLPVGWSPHCRSKPMAWSTEGPTSAVFGRGRGLPPGRMLDRYQSADAVSRNARPGTPANCCRPSWSSWTCDR